MRTTIELPDSLFRRAKAKAAIDGIKLKELIQQFVEVGLDQPTSASPAQRSKPPVIHTKRPLAALTNEQLYGILDEEDAAKAYWD